ncbi:MAG: hypothetical protein ACXV3D_00110 [Halobacteriota archaeon]
MSTKRRIAVVILFVFLFLASVNTVAAASAPPMQWQKTFSGNAWADASDAIQTIDGGYFIVGYTNSSNQSTNDLYFLKTDENGNKLWDLTINATGGEFYRSVLQTRDGGYTVSLYQNATSTVGHDVSIIRVKTDLVTSNATSNVTRQEGYTPVIEWTRLFKSIDADGNFIIRPREDGYMLLSEINSTMLLFKLNTDGNPLWQKNYSVGNQTLIRSYRLTEDDGVLIGAYDNSSGNNELAALKLKSIESLLNSSSSNASQNLELEWKANYGRPGYFLQAAKLATESYLLSGDTNRTGNGSQMYILKTDLNGNPLWENGYGSSEDQFRAVYTTNDNGFLVSSYRGSDLYLVKTDGNGTALWNNAYGGQNVYLRYVEENPDSSFLLAGNANQNPNKMTDYYLQKIDASGTSLWGQAYGSNQDDKLATFVDSNDGGVLLVGHSANAGGDSSAIYLVKVAPEQPSLGLLGSILSFLSNRTPIAIAAVVIVAAVVIYVAWRYMR